MTDPTPPQDQKNPKKDDTIFKGLWLAVQLVWDMGWIIAIPAVVFAFLGATLDKTYHTTPTFILIGLVLALVLSFIGIRRKLKDILEKRF